MIFFKLLLIVLLTTLVQNKTTKYRRVHHITLHEAPGGQWNIVQIIDSMQHFKQQLKTCTDQDDCREKYIKFINLYRNNKNSPEEAKPTFFKWGR